MYRTKVLPFGRAHLGTHLRSTEGKEGKKEGVQLNGEETGELVEPEGRIDAWRRLCELRDDGRCEWDRCRG